MPKREVIHQEYQLIVEPVLGCRKKCRDCCMGELPDEPVLADPKRIGASVREIARQGLLLPEDVATASLKGRHIITYSGRGEPFLHGKLHEVTQAIRETYPNAHICSFWGLGGVESAEELERKSKGLSEITFSLDGHHYAATLRNLFGTRENPRQPGYRLGINPVDGRVTRSYTSEPVPQAKSDFVLFWMMEKIQWGAQAARANGLELKARLTGGKSERRLFANMTDALCYLEEKNGRKIEIYKDYGDRHPRGSELSPKTGLLHVLHDGTITHEFPPARRD